LTGERARRAHLGETRMDIAQKVKEIVSQQLDADLAEIKDTSAFIDDLDADSLAVVELVLAFEEQFEIDIPDEDTEKIRTVGDAISYISSRVSAK
jgi:acyl carrier protein